MYFSHPAAARAPHAARGGSNPTLLPGRLHLACLALFGAASLCHSDDLEFVDDGELGLCACRFW